MRRIIILVAGLAPIACLAALPSEAVPTSSTLRIGVVKTLAPGIPTSLLSTAMRPFREYMEERTGASGEIVRAGDGFDLAEKLHGGKLQVGIFHGHEFAWARQKYPRLAPIVVCVNSLRVMRAALVVPAGTSAESYADLEGKAIALPRDARDYCRVYFEGRCVKPGVEPCKFYSRLLRPADTEEVLDDVAAKRVEAAVVDAAALARYKKANPGRGEKIRVVAESESFPPGVIAFHEGKLSDAEVKKTREALVGAKDSPQGKKTLQLLKLAQFEAAPADYDAALKAIAKAYPPPAGK